MKVETVPSECQADYQSALRVFIAGGMVSASREPADEIALVNRVIDIKRQLLSEQALDYLIAFHKEPGKPYRAEREDEAL